MGSVIQRISTPKYVLGLPDPIPHTNSMPNPKVWVEERHFRPKLVSKGIELRRIGIYALSSTKYHKCDFFPQLLNKSPLS